MVSRKSRYFSSVLIMTISTLPRSRSGSIGARIADMPNVSAQAAARSAASCTSRRSAAATIGGNRFAG
jgi:hypothetical protein